MAKAVKKKIILDSENLKSPKEASANFHNIMKVSVTVGLKKPKPVAKKKSTTKK